MWRFHPAIVSSKCYETVYAARVASLVPTVAFRTGDPRREGQDSAMCAARSEPWEIRAINVGSHYRERPRREVSGVFSTAHRCDPGPTRGRTNLGGLFDLVSGRSAAPLPSPPTASPHETAAVS